MAEKNKSGLGNVVKVAAGLVVGAAAGFAAGVLLAPKTGKETREDVKDISLKLKDDATGYGQDIMGKGEELLKKGSDTLKIGKKNVEDAVIELTTEEKLPVEQVVAKVKKVGNDVKEATEETATKVVKEARDDYSADSLLARIQGITADSLED